MFKKHITFMTIAAISILSTGCGNSPDNNASAKPDISTTTSSVYTTTTTAPQTTTTTTTVNEYKEPDDSFEYIDAVNNIFNKLTKEYGYVQIYKPTIARKVNDFEGVKEEYATTISVNGTIVTMNHRFDDIGLYETITCVSQSPDKCKTDFTDVFNSYKINKDLPITFYNNVVDKETAYIINYKYLIRELHALESYDINDEELYIKKLALNIINYTNNYAGPKKKYIDNSTGKEYYEYHLYIKYSDDIYISLDASVVDDSTILISAYSRHILSARCLELQKKLYSDLGNGKSDEDYNYIRLIEFDKSKIGSTTMDRPLLS